jgi:hypothetical protein
VITGNPPKNDCHHVTHLYLAFVALQQYSEEKEAYKQMDLLDFK